MSDIKNSYKNTLREEPVVSKKKIKSSEEFDVPRNTIKDNPFKKETKKAEPAIRPDEPIRNNKDNQIKDKKVKPSKEEPEEKREFNFDKLTRIIGLFLIFSALFLAFASTSFLYNWHLDFAMPVDGSWIDVLSNPDIMAENAAGKLGNMLAKAFVYDGFGISSYAFVIIFLVSGIKFLTKIEILPIGKTIKYSIFFILWICLTISFFAHTGKPAIYGGSVGYFGNIWLQSLLGKPGMAFLLTFSMMSFLIIALNSQFQWIKSMAIKARDSETLGSFIPKQNSHINQRSSSNGRTIIPGSVDDEDDDDDIEIDENSFVLKTVSDVEENEKVDTSIAVSEEKNIQEKKSIENIINPDVILHSSEQKQNTDIGAHAQTYHKTDEDEEKEVEFVTPTTNYIVEIEEPEIENNTSNHIFEIVNSQPEITIEKTTEPETTLNEIPSEKEDIEFIVEIASEKPSDISSIHTETEKNNSEEDIEELARRKVAEFGEYDPHLDLGNFQFPTLELLENHGSSQTINVQKEELEANKNRIVETLGNYGIKIDRIKATIGPTVTLYEIVPEAGVRISKIKNLEDDIALSLAALGIRIIAPIPGKGTIGIEVPNLHPETVSMRSALASEKFQNANMDLPVAIGKTISNEVFVFDLAKMPHMLMAGATGQGKSVGLNAVLSSLLYKKHPSELKLILVDPKKVELTLFNKIERHYLAKLPDSEEPIITDVKKVVRTLNSLCIEMDNRYDLLKDAQVRNIKEYNAKFKSRLLNPELGHKFLPYIVLVVDEFADLIMTAGREVEMPIARLAQLARAIGIHLIIATQRPSVNIITGTIKANFPARIAFRVTSKIDSRTILDAGGAEQLIGRGDLLFSTGSELIRIQCAFIDTPEVHKITEFIGSQRAYPTAFMLPEVADDDNTGGNNELDAGDRDSMFDEAARIVVQTQQGSTSLIQRKLKLGYNRAGRIIDQLEAAGVVGPFEGSKAREVKIKDLTTLEQLLKDNI